MSAPQVSSSALIEEGRDGEVVDAKPWKQPRLGDRGLQRRRREALVVANDFLEAQLDGLRKSVSAGYARGGLAGTRERNDEADV